MTDTPDPCPGSRPRIAVVFGGRSSEHGVSCLTAQQVMAAIDPERYEVVPIGITADGAWVLESLEPKALRPGVLPEVDATGSDVVLASNHLTVTAPGDIPRELGAVDAVFPLLHGPWGEDGTIQGLCEMAGVRYVGAGVLASALAMDKHYAKIVFADAGLAQLPYAVVTPQAIRSDPQAVDEAVDPLGLPVFVKPARAGSSMGGSLVRTREALGAAIAAAQEHDPKVIVEAGAVGARELECGVVQGQDGVPETSVLGEISVEDDAGHEFYDFSAKYLDGTSANLIPADVPVAVAAKVRTAAVRAFEALGCEGLARVDFFLMPDDRLFINEVNTMPGFTPYSMFPQLWAASGLDYPALVDRLIQLALARTTNLR